MKNLKLFILALIPVTSFAIDPDIIQYPANEYQRQQPEFAERAQDGDSRDREQSREEELSLQAPYDDQQAPKRSQYTPPPFEDPRHMTADQPQMEQPHSEREMGRGLPSHAQPPRRLTPQDKAHSYQGYPAD